MTWMMHSGLNVFVSCSFGAETMILPTSQQMMAHAGMTGPQMQYRDNNYGTDIFRHLRLSFECKLIRECQIKKTQKKNHEKSDSVLDVVDS